MEGLRNAEDVQNQEISDIVCLVQSGRAENGSVQHIFERGENLHWLFCEVEEPLMRLISGTENGQGYSEVLLAETPGHEVTNMGTISVEAVYDSCMKKLSL